jgi:hypothetical protein
MTRARVDSVLWRRLDMPGCDHVELHRGSAGLRLSGVAIFSWRHEPCKLEYEVIASVDGRTRRARVTGRMGEKPVNVRVTADRARRWTLNGRPVPSVQGCIDVDFNFTPATNTLSLLRLDLDKGQSAPVRSAWLKFPELTLHPLEQKYRRLDAMTYRYESPRFQTVLDMSPSGLILRYGTQWICIAGSSGRPASPTPFTRHKRGGPASTSRDETSRFARVAARRVPVRGGAVRARASETGG